MVEFKSAYFHPMDRKCYEWQPKAEEQASFEKPIHADPIIPLKKLGQTVPETDPRTGANILQNVASAIRAGAGTIQLAMTVNPQAAMGGRPKGYGKEVRTALREMLQSSKVTLEGLELPTAVSNVTGLQEGGFDEQRRKETLDEVHDSMRFIAEVARGGGVDIFSQEFPRPLAVAKWNQNDKMFPGAFKLSNTEEDDAPLYLVDKRTGKVIHNVRRGHVAYAPKYLMNEKKEFIDRAGNAVTDLSKRVPVFNEKTGKFDIDAQRWPQFVEEAERLNKQKKAEFVAQGKKFGEQEMITPEEAFFRQTVASEEGVAKAWALQYAKKMPEHLRSLERLQSIEPSMKAQEKNANQEQLMQLRAQALAAVTPGIDPEQLQELAAATRNRKPSEIIAESMSRAQREIEEAQNMSVSQQMKEQESENLKENIVSIDKYAKQKAWESYAELGMIAFEETKKNPNIVDNKGNFLPGAKPLFVGPENGWPTAYGGHPDEFIELIKKSREKMAEQLQARGVEKEQAKKASQEHIKGLFDTGHLGQWFSYFHPKDNAGKEITSYDERLKLFNGWYLEQVKKMAKENIIGSVQAVDSAGGAHAHLPAGQGIFPVVKAVEILKKEGNFNGFVISEGHEEEGYSPGRILTKTWEAFGGAITGNYTMPMQSGPRTWGSASQAYFGRSYPPDMMFGGYAPSNEFRLWSEVPME